MNPNILYLFNKVSIEADKSTHHKVSIGAILVNKGKIVSRGFNKMRHNVSEHAKWNNSLHAEIDCLLKAPRTKIEGSTLIIYRKLRNGALGLARPCNFCMAAIEEFKVKKIIYTTYDGYREEKIK